MRLLVVEDDDLDAEALERAVKRAEPTRTVSRANDGEQALAMLRDIDEPVIVLLDLNMPRMNGFEFLEAIRHDPDLSVTVVFVVTTSEDERDRISAYRHHVAGYITKAAAGPRFDRLVGLLASYTELVSLP